MNEEEYLRLEEIDRRHWFYQGKRRIVCHWIDRYLRLQPTDLLVDAGAGTGTWLSEMSGRCRVLGLDSSATSIALAGARLTPVGGRLVRTELGRVGLPDACAAVVTMMDVLEHLDDDAGALREMIRLVRPGGLLVVTVPAHRWLWSDWDVALHHRRRYSRRVLLALVNQPGVELLHCAYFNSLLLPAIALVRGWRRLRPSAAGARLEDRVPSAPVNTLLYHAMVAPACWKALRLPWGVSLLAVLRRVSEVSPAPAFVRPKPRGPDSAGRHPDPARAP
jgi:SAM-dependent methyltransferase